MKTVRDFILGGSKITADDDYSHEIKRHLLFGTVYKAELDFFFFFSGILLLFVDQTDVGVLISGSSAFSKSSLNIWKIMVHILLKPGLENFEHCFTCM